MPPTTNKRKPNRRDEQDLRRQKMALRDIERAIEIAMNSGVSGPNVRSPKDKNKKER